MQSKRHVLQKTSLHRAAKLNTEDARKTRILSHQWSSEADATGDVNASRNFGKAGARGRHRFG
jgi:hypothetical protein